MGLSLGARLAAAGNQVCYLVRRASQARALRAGVWLEDPGSGEVVQASVRAVTTFAEAADFGAWAFLLCTRATDTRGLAEPLARASQGAPVVSVQNHVDNEALLAEHCRHVLGAVWRQTCMRVGDGSVRALGRPRVVVGAYPEGADTDSEWLCKTLQASGCDAAVSRAIMQDKWLKLCVNLMSVPNALVRPGDHAGVAFVEGKARLLEEARDVLRASGIETNSADGRDRSLDEEIVYQRTALVRGTSARKLPVYNQVWRAFDAAKRSFDLDLAPEADDYHRRICELAAKAGVPAPLNRRVLERTERAWAERRGPECFGAEELFGNLF